MRDDRVDSTVKHFTDLRVWRKAHQLFLNLVVDLRDAAIGGALGVVGDQLLRSCGSVGAKIAEGFNRSRKRFAHCLDVAIGEANELENWLYKARDAGLLSAERSERHLRTTVAIEKMLAGLRRKILDNRSAAWEQEPGYEIDEVPGADF